MVENARIIAQLLIATMLILAAVFHREIWWIGLLFFEITIVISCGELLAMNLPRRLSRQRELNKQRSDGTKSRRRSLIERQACLNFKVKLMSSLTLIFIPINACIMTYAFFLPTLKRISINTHIDHEYRRLEVFLQPEVQMLFLGIGLAIFAAIATSNFYMTHLKELDIELTCRAEQYAVHDLLHPPSKQHMA